MSVELYDEVAPIKALHGQVSEIFVGQVLLGFRIVPTIPNEGQLPSYYHFVAARGKLLSLTLLEQRESFSTRLG